MRAYSLSLAAAALPISTAAALAALVSGTGAICLAAIAAGLAGLRRLMPRRAPSLLSSLLLVMGAGLLLRLAYAGAVGVRPVSDYAVFEELALSVSRGNGVSYDGPASAEDLALYQGVENPDFPRPTLWRAPGPALLGGLLYRFGGGHPELYAAANLAAGLWLLWLLYALGRRWGGRLAGLAAAGLWAIYPAGIAATTLFGGDLIHAALLAAAAERLSRGEDETWDWFWAGGLSSLACLFRPTSLFLLTAGALASARQPARVLAFGAGFMLLTVPWGFRNGHLSGSWSPFAANPGDTFARHALSMIPLDDPRRDGLAPFVKRWRGAKSEAERGRRGYRVGLAALSAAWSAGPRASASLLFSNLRDSFSTDRQMFFFSGSESRPRLEALGTAFFAALWPLVIFGALKRAPPEWNPGIAFLFWHFLITFAVFLLVPGIDRYHFPVMPFACLAAGLALAPTERYP
jgi:hypothetical protein